MENFAAMAPRSSICDEINERFMQCSICLEQYKEPKVLPCLHRYCRNCLKTLLIKKAGTIGQKKTLKCPQCCQMHKIPINGIKGFQTDFLLKGVIEFINLKKKSLEEQGKWDGRLGHCTCYVDGADCFKKYQTPDDKVLGVICQKCGKEWLKQKYLGANTFFTDNCIRFGDQWFCERRNLETATFLRSVAANDTLEVGDYIRWSEMQGSEQVEFDAIVEGLNASTTSISAIIMQRVRFCVLKVNHVMIDLTKINNLQIVQYQFGSDPPELTRARAMAWWRAETCNLFTAKSDLFTSYCKCGSSEEFKAMWLVGTLVTQTVKNLLGQTSWDRSHEEDYQHVLTHGGTSNNITNGVLFVMDDTALALDIESSEDIAGVSGVSQVGNVYKTFCKTLVRSLQSSGLIVSETMVNQTTDEKLLSLEIPDVNVSVTLIQIKDGTAQIASLKATKTFFGGIFGQMIHKSVKRGDRLAQIDEIQPGDQVVLPGDITHPRCHGIVLIVIPESNKLKLIRNTYEKGVIEELVDVSSPILRVTYADDTAYPADDVIKRAKSRLGENRYNLLTYNCKHYATWCKRK